MTSWFSRRLAEPSTRLGGLVFASALTHILTNPPVTKGDWFSTILAILGGIFAVATPEIASPDADPSIPVRPHNAP